MSKIEWDSTVAGRHRHAGTDGLGVVVTARKVISGGQQLLHIDILVYLDEQVSDPRPAIEAAVQTLREQLGME